MESGVTNTAQWIGNLILFLALLSAIWYALETRKMRLQMIRPKLVFLMRAHVADTLADTTRFDLVISNVGDGAALNILIERVHDQEFQIRFDPEHIPVLRKGEQCQLAMLPVKGSYHPDLSVILDEPSISQKMVARYVDVQGRPFRTSTMVGGGAKPPFIKDETA